jgi:CelD/BcsL family acetyltransferase involved in cellulose biosynthesis
MPDRLKAEEVADTAGLEALRADWVDLWRRVPTATPFQSPAWLVPWWRVFDDGELMS